LTSDDEVIHISSDGSTQEYPTSSCAANGVDSTTAGPDGNLWLTTGASVCRMSTEETVTGVYPLPEDMASSATPEIITSGPDGDVVGRAGVHREARPFDPPSMTVEHSRPTRRRGFLMRRV
jgi:streptogramin lyase